MRPNLNTKRNDDMPLVLTRSGRLPTTSNRTCIILNPAARSERARSLARKVQSLTSGTVIKLTEGPGDAEAKAERAVAQGFKTIVAAGGDGTINEVVNGLAGAPVHLGILPIGTINVFAQELGLPMDVEKAWRVVLKGKTRSIDLPSANDHHFVQLAGVGLDAEVVAKTNWESKKALGPLSYALTATQMMTRKPPKLRIHTETNEVLRGSFVLIGNGRFYGGPFEIFKDGRLDDGLLDVCVFEQQNPLALIRYIQGVLTGSHTKFHDVNHFKCNRVRIEADEVVPVEVDGELLGYLPCEFSLRKDGLSVIVP
jgi:diacylglycerol kinase (ATP)